MTTARPSSPRSRPVPQRRPPHPRRRARWSARLRAPAARSVQVDPISGPTIVGVTHAGDGPFSVQPQQGGVPAGPPFATVEGPWSGRYLVGLGGTISGFAVTADGDWTLAVEQRNGALTFDPTAGVTGENPDVVAYETLRRGRRPSPSTAPGRSSSALSRWPAPSRWSTRPDRSPGPSRSPPGRASSPSTQPEAGRCSRSPTADPDFHPSGEVSFQTPTQIFPTSPIGRDLPQMEAGDAGTLSTPLGL